VLLLLLLLLLLLERRRRRRRRRGFRWSRLMLGRSRQRLRPIG
jgi:hypothetical protein